MRGTAAGAGAEKRGIESATAAMTELYLRLRGGGGKKEPDYGGLEDLLKKLQEEDQKSKKQGKMGEYVQSSSLS